MNIDASKKTWDEDSLRDIPEAFRRFDNARKARETPRGQEISVQGAYSAEVNKKSAVSPSDNALMLLVIFLFLYEL